VHYLDKEQIAADGFMRNIIYDVYCDTDSGEKIIVEMQKCDHPNFAQRMVYYAASAITKQGEKGREWEYEIKAVYCIALMNFTESSLERKVVTHVGLCDWNNGKHFLDSMRFVFIQLPLFSKKEGECVSLEDKWLYVLKNMDMLDRLPKEFQSEAFKKLKEVSDLSKLNEEERYAYDRSLREYRDAINIFEGARRKGIAEGEAKGRAEGIAEGEAKGRAEGIAEGEAKGRAEGIAEGEAKGRAEGETQKAISIARSLKKMNMSTSDISAATGLSVEEVEKL
jgi:predicted transposase/invertase (TIGR01784 family)